MSIEELVKEEVELASRLKSNRDAQRIINTESFIETTGLKIGYIVDITEKTGTSREKTTTTKVLGYRYSGTTINAVVFGIYKTDGTLGKRTVTIYRSDIIAQRWTKIVVKDKGGD